MAKTLAEHQAEAKELLGEELKHPRVGAVLGLSEEVGELVKEIMELEIYSTPQFPLDEQVRTALGDEAADVLFSLVEVCSAYGIDLETAYETKLAKIRGKREEWIARYSPGLRLRREKLD